MTTDVIVVSTGLSRGTVSAGTIVFPCVLGRSGIRALKHEGDGATPAGRFPLRSVFYRADRGTRPVTALPVAVLATDDGWCDDPSDPLYNRAVKLPYLASAEHLWHTDALYDVIVVIGHNDDPAVPGYGSAIFLHVSAPDETPTAGCIALTKPRLLKLLEVVGPLSSIEIRDS